MSQYELESQWITPEGVAGVIYRFGDTVLLTTSERAGQSGVVVALLSTKPEPTYVVEFPDGRSATAAQGGLQSTGSSSGRTLHLRKTS